MKGRDGVALLAGMAAAVGANPIDILEECRPAPRPPGGVMTPPERKRARIDASRAKQIAKSNRRAARSAAAKSLVSAD